jgi:hypothetical protein
MCFCLFNCYLAAFGIIWPSFWRPGNIGMDIAGIEPGECGGVVWGGAHRIRRSSAQDHAQADHQLLHHH